MLTLIEDSLMREEILDIHTLKRRGYSDRKIARELGIHRNTVRKYLENPDRLLQRNKYHRPSKLEPFYGNIKAWLESDQYYTATWIYDHLVPLGFDGSYEIIKRKVKVLHSITSFTDLNLHFNSMTSFTLTHG